MKKSVQLTLLSVFLSFSLSSYGISNKPLSIDDYLVEQNEVTETGFCYDIHFSLTNTTDTVLDNYNVDFTTDSCKDAVKPIVAPTIISGLKPLETGHFIVSVTPASKGDESITGHLVDSAGRSISPVIALKKNFDQLFILDTTSISCTFTDADTVANKAFYTFRALVQNMTSETSSRSLYLQYGDNKAIVIAVDSLKPNEKKLVSSTFALPVGIHKLIVCDSRKVVLCDTFTLEITDYYKQATPFFVNCLWKTVCTYDEKDSAIYLSNKEDTLLAGLENITVGLNFGEESDISVWPKKGVMRYGIKDVYGKQYCYQDLSRIVSQSFQDACESGGLLLSESSLSTIKRGGEYVFGASLDVFGFKKQDTVCIYDNPSLRYYLNSSFLTIGQDFNFKAAANTGYPYADSVKNTVYTYQYEVIYIKPHNGRAEGDTIRHWRDDSQILNLNVERYPRLAGVDTVKYDLIEPDLGEYITVARSNFKNHFQTIGMSVKDTVRMETELTKEYFRKGIDTLATIHYKIDHKWPYISKNQGDTCPIVRLKAEHHNDSINISHEDSLKIEEWLGLKTHKDSLRSDSLVKARTYKINIVSDSLLIQVPENTFLDIEGDFTFNIGQLGVGTSSVNFTVNFNQMDQKKEDVNIRVKRVGTDKDTILVDDDPDAPIYDLLGRRIEPSDLTRGVYIRNGKKLLML